MLIYEENSELYKPKCEGRVEALARNRSIKSASFFLASQEIPGPGWTRCTWAAVHQDSNGQPGCPGWHSLTEVSQGRRGFSKVAILNS